MVSRILSGGAIAAVAGAAMLAVSSAPSPAFTLSSPSLEQPVAAAALSLLLARRMASWMGPAWGWGWHRGWGWHGG